MAEGTRIKELSLELRRVTEQMEKNHADAHSDIKRLEVQNGARFEKIEQTMLAQNEVLQKLLDAMNLRDAEKSSSSSTLDMSGNGKLKSPVGVKIPENSGHRTPFQDPFTKPEQRKFGNQPALLWSKSNLKLSTPE